MKKLATQPFLVFFIIFIAFNFTIQYLFEPLNKIITPLVAGPIAVFLSPRKIKTQNGEKNQIKWIFLKKVIEIDQ